MILYRKDDRALTFENFYQQQMSALEPRKPGRCAQRSSLMWEARKAAHEKTKTAAEELAHANTLQAREHGQGRNSQKSALYRSKVSPIQIQCRKDTDF